MFSRVAAAAVAIVALVLTSACGSDSPTVPDGYDIPSLQTIDLVVGTGAEAIVGRSVTVHYSGWVYSPTGTDNKGTLFDTSNGRAPFPVTLGAGGVISGFDQGIRGMRVGGRRRILIPSSLAYGRSGNQGIPPNSAIVFDVELVSVQ